MKAGSILSFSIAGLLVAAASAQDSRPFAPPPPLEQKPGVQVQPEAPVPPETPQPTPQTPPQKLPKPVQPPPPHGLPPQTAVPRPEPDAERHEPEEGPRHPGKKQPFLGVVTEPISDSLRVQLGLPEDFGLVIYDVLPGSPAANAGIMKYDVVKDFNDQHLVNPEQLAALVHALGKDAEATLTIVRQGKEQKITIKVGEHELPMEHGHGRDWRPMPPMPKHDGRFGEEREKWGDDMRKWGKDMEEHAQQWGKEMQDRAQQWNKDAQQWNKDVQHRAEQWNKDAQEQAMRAMREVQKRMQYDRKREADADRHDVAPEAILHDAEAGEGKKIRVISDGALTTVDVSKALVRIKDRDGDVEIASENGKRTLTARNPQGEVVFSGPIDTEEQRKALPEDLQKKLKTVKLITKQAGDAQATAEVHVEANEAGDSAKNVQ